MRSCYKSQQDSHLEGHTFEQWLSGLAGLCLACPGNSTKACRVLKAVAVLFRFKTSRIKRRQNIIALVETCDIKVSIAVRLLIHGQLYDEGLV